MQRHTFYRHFTKFILRRRRIFLPVFPPPVSFLSSFCFFPRPAFSKFFFHIFFTPTQEGEFSFQLSIFQLDGSYSILFVRKRSSSIRILIYIKMAVDKIQEIPVTAALPIRSSLTDPSSSRTSSCYHRQKIVPQEDFL